MSLREEITKEFMGNSTFAEIMVKLNGLSTQEKDAFANLCIMRSNQLPSYLGQICTEIAKGKADIKLVSINASGKVDLTDVQTYLKP